MEIVKLVPATVGITGTLVHTGVRPKPLPSKLKPTVFAGQLKLITPALKRRLNGGGNGGALGATVLVNVSDQPPAKVPMSPP